VTCDLASLGSTSETDTTLAVPPCLCSILGFSSSETMRWMVSFFFVCHKISFRDQIFRSDHLIKSLFSLLVTGFMQQSDALGEQTTENHKSSETTTVTALAATIRAIAIAAGDMGSKQYGCHPDRVSRAGQQSRRANGSLDVNAENSYDAQLYLTMSVPIRPADSRSRGHRPIRDLDGRPHPARARRPPEEVDREPTDGMEAPGAIADEIIATMVAAGYASAEAIRSTSSRS